MNKLPEICASRKPSDGAPIVIKRGVCGYWPMPTDFDVEGFNTRHGITAAMRQAMEIGSMFGWDVPGAKMA